MERNFRFRVSGLTFFVIILLHFALTVSGKKFLQDLFLLNSAGKQFSLDQFQILSAIASVIFLVFASDFAGYIFSSIYVAWFNIVLGGYAKKYSGRFGNLDEIIVSIYDETKMPKGTKIPKNLSLKNFEERLKKQYNPEHFLIYFLWHRPDGVSDNLNDWIERRHTAYFTSFSFVTAAICATLLSFFFCYTYANFVILFLTTLISVAIAINGSYAMRDAIAITELHIAGFFNPKIRAILEKYPPPIKSKR